MGITNSQQLLLPAIPSPPLPLLRMPPSICHAVFRSEQSVMDMSHPEVATVLEDEAEYDIPLTLVTQEASTSSLTSLPPAFNPEYVAALMTGSNAAKQDIPRSSENSQSTATGALAPVQMQTAGFVDFGTGRELQLSGAQSAKAASAPVPAERVDPFIAAVFQCGFSKDARIREGVDEETPDAQEVDARSCVNEEEEGGGRGELMAAKSLVSPTDRLEKRFFQESRRKEAERSSQGSPGESTSSASYPVDSSSLTEETVQKVRSSCSSMRNENARAPETAATTLLPAVTGHVPPGTKANPPSAPRFIPLAHHGSYYARFKPYAQLLAWRTQQRTKAAVDRALRFQQKHTPTVVKVVQKSAKFVRKATRKSVELAAHHGPIVGRRVKRASIQTYEGIKEMEANHQIIAKSKEGIRDVWSRQCGTRASF